MDKKTGKADKAKGRPRFMKQGDVCIARFVAQGVICMEAFKDHPQMGRFTLRDEGALAHAWSHSQARRLPLARS